MQTRIRIVALGDSTTAGTPGFLSPIEAPPNGRGDETSQYAYWLMKAHQDWEVLNRGVDGQRTDQIAARFDRDVVAASPRAVVIIAGVNDIYQGRSVEYVTTELRKMYDRTLRSGIKLVAGSIIPFNTAKSEQNERMRVVNEWIRAQSNASLAFVDTRAAVAAPGKPDLLARSPDQLHPSVEGYRHMAEAIGRVLAKVLNS